VAGERILVVEDNPMNMELATDLLELGGFAVEQATDGGTGLDMARTCAPDLILLDVGLPDRDGFDLARQLHEDAVTSGIPIVIFTAHAMKQDEMRAYEVGCIGFITKPVETQTFCERVSDFLRRRR